MVQRRRARARKQMISPGDDPSVRYAVIFLVLMVRFFFIPMSPYNVFRIIFIIFLLLVDPKHSGSRGFVDGRILYALSIFFIIEPFHHEGEGG